MQGDSLDFLKIQQLPEAVVSAGVLAMMEWQDSDDCSLASAVERIFREMVSALDRSSLPRK